MTLQYGGIKTKLSDLYILSFTEPIDVIQAIDPENADIIKIFKEYDNPEDNTTGIRRRTGLSFYNIRKLLKLNDRHIDGEDISTLIHHTTRPTIDIKQVINLIEHGESCKAISGRIGYGYTTTHDMIRFIGYRFNNNLNRWEKL